MFRYKRYRLYLVVCVVLLFCGGCFPNHSITNNETDLLNNSELQEEPVESSVYETDNSMSHWVGQYRFSEFQPPNMNMVYRLNIYYENEGYWADLEMDGWMVMARIKAKVQGSYERISIVFDQYTPENPSPSFCRANDVLFNLEIRDGEIITIWGVIPALKLENRVAQVCFTKDVDIKQFLQEFNEQQIEENLKRLYFLMTEGSAGELLIGQGYPEAEKQKFSEEKIEIDHNLTFIANKRYKVSEIMVVQPAYLAEKYNLTISQTSKFGEDILLLSYGTEEAGFSLWLTKNEEVFLWLHDESDEQTGLYALQPVISEDEL
jgi:hypothetical protein